MDESHIERVIDRVFLSETGDYVTQTNSAAVLLVKKKVSISATMVNLVGTNPRVVVALEGTYDGRVWKSTSLPDLSLTAFTEDHSSAGVAMDFAMVRIQLSITPSGSNDASVLVDASIAMSD